MTDTVLERVAEGKCPICKTGISTVKKVSEDAIQVVEYKGLSITICKKHPVSVL